MRLGLGTSTALHAGVLAWALFSIGGARPLDEAVVESLPVEIIPLEEFAALVKGAEEASPLDAPAPEPTDAEPAMEDAVNAGEAQVDADVPPAPVVAPVPVEATPPPAAEEPAPVPDPFEIAAVPAPTDRPVRPSVPTTEIAPVPEPEAPVAPDPVETVETPPEPQATPEPEPTPEPTPAPEPTPEPPEPDPVTEAIETAELRTDAVQELVDKSAQAASEAVEAAAAPRPSEPAEPEPPRFDALPSGGPVALARPKARPARTPERRAETEIAKAAPTETGEPNVTDKIAALLDQRQASGGGARRQDTPASLGGERTTGAELSRSEMDGLKRAIQRCWSPPAGTSDAASLVVKVRMELDAGGTVQGRPEVVDQPAGAQGNAAAGAAVRAMLRCGPYALPADKHDVWSTVVVNFDPRDMF